MNRPAGSHRVILILLGLAMLFAPRATWADSGTAHQISQTRPIQLGTSGGNIKDVSRLYCCSGTLGALVQNVNTQFILSNNHVLARTNQAVAGEDITQPGLVDLKCAQDTQYAVANLSTFKKISFESGTLNTVDAAIAQVRPGAVNSGGSILDIGQVSSATAAPSLGMAVKKSGRTTGLTTGSISAINLTVDIYYNKHCGIGSQRARFTNQIAIGPGTFSGGGDSGSLIVENVTTCPRPVGLLFAGSGTVTLANPINNVLSSFGVTMTGCSSAHIEQSLLRRIVAWFLPAASAADRPLVDPAAIAEATHLKERHERDWLRIPGVLGAGIGLSEVAAGHVAIHIYVERDTPEVRRALPAQLDGVRVEIVETGPIVARDGSCGEGF